MEWYFSALILFAVLIPLLIIGMPIAFALGLTGVVGLLLFVGPQSLTMVGSFTWEKSTSWSLVCLPLFILMAEIMVFADIGSEAFKAANLWLGRLPGGVGIATVAACAVFAAASGSSTACATAIGIMSVPEMRKIGYSKGLATGITAAGGTLGILIPPSIVMVIYGTLTEQSIGHLFIAGIIPGIILSAIFAFYVLFTALRHPDMAPRSHWVSWSERWAALKGIIGVIVIIFFVFGSLYSGICTPTEVSAIGAVGAFIVALMYRKLTWTNLRVAFLHTVRTNSFIFFIIFGAMVFTGLVSYLGISEKMTQAVTQMGLPPIGVLVIIYVIYLFLGCFLDPTGMMLLTLPFFFPIIVKLGYDPIWFGVLVTILCEMGYLTPPFGFNLYVLKGIAPEDIRLEDIMVGCIPFVFLMLIAVALLTAFPEIVLYLPSKMAQ